MISDTVFAAGLKIGVAPLLMWGLLHLAGVHGDLLDTGVMLGAMPTSVMSSVLSRHHGLDGEFAVRVVFVTTVLSAFTVPLWIAVVH